MSALPDSLDLSDVMLFCIVGGWSKFESGLFDLYEATVLEVRQAFWTAARP